MVKHFSASVCSRVMIRLGGVPGFTRLLGIGAVSKIEPMQFILVPSIWKYQNSQYGISFLKIPKNLLQKVPNVLEFDPVSACSKSYDVTAVNDKTCFRNTTVCLICTKSTFGNQGTVYRLKSPHRWQARDALLHPPFTSTRRRK